MQKQREHWGSHLGFFLAAAGSAIGLGVLWKFPYVTGENGGGLFVLFYILCTFCICVPVFIAELILGRHSQRGVVGTFSMLSNDSALWKLTGWFGVGASFLIMSYYSVLAGWGLNYVLMSLNQFYVNRTNAEISEIFHILARSGDITLFWHLIFTSIVLSVVYLGIRQGIEYWSKFMTSSLFILLVGLFLYSTTLPGFNEAVHFLFYPDVSKFKASGALEALGLAFFTMSLGQGIMITYGSYMRRTEDIPKTGGLIGTTIISVSCLAGLTIFPVVFTFGQQPEAGTGLVFKTLPLVFAQLPGGMLISTAFFILFVFAALTSAIPLIEVVVANIIDLQGWSRKKAVLVTGISCFIFGIPSALSETDTLFANWKLIYGKNFFSTIDALTTNWLLPIGGLMVSIFTGWFMDQKICKDEFFAGSSWGWLWHPWRFFIRWVAPIGITAIILQQTGIINFDTFFRTG